MALTDLQVRKAKPREKQAGEERAAYGEALIKRLSVDLSTRFGRGYSIRNLEQMRQFYQGWPITQTVSAQLPATLNNISADTKINELTALAQHFPLPWSAYVHLLAVKNPIARNFYETEALRCGWSVRQLDRQISSQFYERILALYSVLAKLRPKHIMHWKICQIRYWQLNIKQYYRMKQCLPMN